MKAFLFTSLLYMTAVESVRFGAGTTCVGSDGTILGEVSCGAAPTKLIVSASVAVAQVSRAAAGEYIEACEKTYGEDRVHQVGRQIFDSAVRNFVAYTVDEGGAAQVPLDSLDAVKRYRKAPPPPPPPKKNAANTMLVSPGCAMAILLLASITCIV